MVAPVSANAGICGSMVVAVAAATKPDISLFNLWLTLTFMPSSLSAYIVAPMQWPYYICASFDLSVIFDIIAQKATLCEKLQ